MNASVEFGLEIAVEAGKLTALLVEAGGTATLKIADAGTAGESRFCLTISSTERARLFRPSSRMPTGVAYSIPARWPTTTPRQVSWITP